MKRCARCKAERPIAEFGNDSSQRDGHAIYCKPCAREKARVLNATYRLRNPEKARDQVRRYRAADPERTRRQARESQRRWRERHPAGNAANKKRRRALQPDAVRAENKRGSKRYRAIQRGALVAESVDYDAILARSEPVCHICGFPIEKKVLQFDHIYPVSRGGSHTVDNIAPAHRKCNRAKENKLPGEWEGVRNRMIDMAMSRKGR